MEAKERLTKICEYTLQKINNPEYEKRYKWELWDLDAQNEYDYFLKLFDAKKHFSKNKKNTIIPYLMGLVDDFDISQPNKFKFGESPDIDIDYLPIVRDYIKNTWAIEQFGRNNVCAIGNYTTFGIKSALIDMARVHDKDRNEILAITTKLGLKDEDGKLLTWDKAMEIYPELKAYCERNPEVAETAQRLLNRNRGMGTHAGGLIISKSRIDNLVPLVRGKDGQYVSAFVEGLHGTDLGPLGLIKFDLLVITNLMQIANCCKLIKDRHKLTSICALPGQSDWSDTSYLNDPMSIALANQAKLKCIFQFDSAGIRDLVFKCGVDSFDDLVAIASIFRPGPMGLSMHERYIERKRGREEYVIPEVMKPILQSTYGVMCFQEQVMKILNIVGKIPLKDCEIVRKAISKKKVKDFAKYKEMFIKNGQVILQQTEQQLINLWDQIEAFAEYGFNKCLVGNTVVQDAKTGKRTTIVEMYNQKISEFHIHTLNEQSKQIEIQLVKDVVYNGFRKVYRLKTQNGKEVTATDNHPFMTKNDWKQLKELNLADEILCVNKLDLFWDKIVSIEYVGEEDVYDLEIDKNHNFVANDIIVHNSHAVAYTYISSRLLWLKAHYPLEFFASILSCETVDTKVREYKLEAQKFGVILNRLDLNKSKENFQIINDSLYIGFANIKGIGKEVAERIVAGQPYSSFEDFLLRFGTDATVLKPLIGLRIFGEQDPVALFEFCEYYKDQITKRQARDRRNIEARDGILSELRYLLPEDKKNLASHELIQSKNFVENNNLDKEMAKIVKKYHRSLDGYKAKLAEDKSLSLATFEPTGKIDETLKAIYQSHPQVAEVKYYGFGWQHHLESSPDTSHRCFSHFEEDETLLAGPVEVEVIQFKKIVAKTGTVFYIMVVEDIEWTREDVVIWKDDYERFQQEILVGNLLRIKVSRPNEKSKGYTFYSPPRHMKHKLGPKETDGRLVVLRKN